MKRENALSVLGSIFLITCCALCSQAQPWRGGLNVHPSVAALNPRLVATRLIAHARTKTPRPIRMRTLSVPTNLKRSPVFPLESRSHEMYRGLALDRNGNELRNILHNGMPVQTSHFSIWHGAYDGKLYRDGTKALFATTDPLLASTYAQMNRFREDGNLFLPVVLHLKRVGEENANKVGRSVEIPHDIPASWIHKVSVLLNVDGQLRWGELKLDGEDGFLFFPYPLN